ncbi:MAG: ABC transporter substrate-binding protein, partial [Candidatus Pacebacteria bacterium]|nr:ABC transporter substrate-binding protein [Candidatus Paceibacterota bacterium]
MKFLNKKKIPSLGQWRSLYKVFTKKEKIGFSLILAIFIISFITFLVSTYFSKTKEVPAFGGTYIEGLIGYPRFINPIYSLSDVDRNITSLLFSGLLYYDHSKGFVMNMAETIIKEESSYRMKLRDDLKWSNGKAITAQDIIFTINTIQDPAFKSPLRADWIGIKVEKVSDLE